MANRPRVAAALKLIAASLLISGAPFSGAPFSGAPSSRAWAQPKPAAVPLADLAAAAAATALRDGQAALAAKDYAAAGTAFEAANRANPGAADPYVGLIEVALRLRGPQAATEMLRAGLAAAPGSSALRIVEARFALVQNRLPDAVRAFQTAIALDPTAIAPRLDLADVYALRLHQPADALPTYDEVLARDPGNAAATYGRGIALASLGRGGDAVVALRAAQAAAPGSPRPSLAAGRILLQAGRRDEALAAFDGALKIAPGTVAASFGRAEALEALGQTDAAAAAYAEVLRQDPKSVAALDRLAMLRQAGGDMAAAAQGFRAALAVNGDDILALNNLAFMAAEQRADLDQALVWARRAVELGGPVPGLLDTLGWVQRQRGDLAAAAATLQAAVGQGGAQQGGAVPIFLHLAQVRADLGQTEAAREAVRRALALAPDDPAAKAALSRLGG